MEVDLKKHLLYSKQIEEIAGGFIRKKLGEEAVESVLNDVREQYAIFLKDLPYLGGKKCTHNGVGGTYDCIYVFALYEVLEIKPTIEELYEINNAVLLPSFQNMPKFVNANKPWVLRLINFVFKVTAKEDKKLRKTSSGGYIMEVEPYDPKVGARYHFDYCPIAEFARRHGYLDIMPAFCNSDYPAMEAIHASLIRKNTCANSTHCDYWIVGDQSKYAKQYPMKKDDKGYFYNDVNQIDLLVRMDGENNYGSVTVSKQIDFEAGAQAPVKNQGTDESKCVKKPLKSTILERYVSDESAAAQDEEFIRR